MTTKEYNKQYYLKHRKEEIRKSIEWARENPEKTKIINNRSYYKNRAERLEKKKKYYKNKGYLKLAEYRKNNPEKVAKWKRDYYQRHKEEIKAKQRKTNRRLRFDILNRDNFTCQYCGRKAPDVVLEIDHIYPKSLGGKNVPENYKTACVDCNSGKRDILLTLL